LVPENFVIHFHLGIVYFALGEAGRSLESFKKAIGLGLDGAEQDEAERILEKMKGGA
jgi:hypothetical protein